MSFFNFLKQESIGWFSERIPKEKTPGDITYETIKKDTKYIKIYIKSIWLPYVRKGISKFYGAVNSYAKVSHKGGTPAEFNLLVSPQAMQNVDASDVKNIIFKNQKVLGPIPYRGDDLELNLSLVAVKAGDIVSPYLNLLQTISDKAGVQFLNIALPFAEPLKTGIDLLFNTDNNCLEIGMAANVSTLETGYYLVSKTKKGTKGLEDYKIDKGDYKLIGDVVNQNPYIVYSIEASDTRDDYFLIPEILAAYETVRADVRANKETEARASLANLRRIMLTSYDLLNPDAITIYNQINKEINDVMGTGPMMVSSTKKDLPELNHFKLGA